MAIVNDPRMYSAGNVAFDSTPSVNLFYRLQEKRNAEQKAKDEAANQYFTNVVKELNPAGIRQIHLGGVQGQPKGIIDRINEWKDWSIKNRGTIAKGGTARMQSDMMAQEIMRDIAKAKNRDKQLLELGKLKFEGKYDPTDDDFKLIEKFGKSIYDPQSYKEDGVSEYGFEDLSPNIPDYDINKAFETGSKGMKGGRTFDEAKGRRDAQTGLEWIPYTDKFSGAQIPQIAKNVANEYATNKSAKKYWDEQYKKVGEEDFKKINAAFKQYFPQGTIRLPNGQTLDLSDVDNAEEFAIASTALRAKEFISEQGEVPKTDYEKRKQDNITKLYIQDGLIRGRQQGSATAEDLVKYDVLETYKDKKKPMPLGNNWLGKSKTDPSTEVILFTDVDKKDQELINVKPYTAPDGRTKYYKTRPDGDWEGAGGQVISWAKVAQANLDKTSANEVKRGRTGLTADKTKQPTGNKPTYQGLDKNGNPIFK